MNKILLFRFLAFYLPLFVVLILIFLLTFNFIEKIVFSSFFYAFLIALINFTIGFFAINFGLEKNDKSFLIIVFGAIIIRFFIVFFMIIGVISFLDVRTDYFIFTTFIIYFYYLVIEILYLKNIKNVEILGK